MKEKKSFNCRTEKIKRAAGNGIDSRIQDNAYGDKVTICHNAGCVMRKKAKCLGFEGCPGFRGR